MRVRAASPLERKAALTDEGRRLARGEEVETKGKCSPRLSAKTPANS